MFTDAGSPAFSGPPFGIRFSPSSTSSTPPSAVTGEAGSLTGGVWNNIDVRKANGDYSLWDGSIFSYRDPGTGVSSVMLARQDVNYALHVATLSTNGTYLDAGPV